MFQVCQNWRWHHRFPCKQPQYRPCYCCQGQEAHTVMKRSCHFRECLLSFSLDFAALTFSTLTQTPLNVFTLLWAYVTLMNYEHFLCCCICVTWPTPLETTQGFQFSSPQYKMDGWLSSDVAWYGRNCVGNTNGMTSQCGKRMHPHLVNWNPIFFPDNDKTWMLNVLKTPHSIHRRL